MAARPNQAQLQKQNARPGNAPAHGSGGVGIAPNGRVAQEGGSGDGRRRTGSSISDEGTSQQSRSMGDSASITVMQAVSSWPPPTPYRMTSAPAVLFGYVAAST